MKKIAYVANIRIPTEKAHGIQIMEMCSAFIDTKYDVELIVPKRKNDITEDAFVYHDIQKRFQIKHLPCIDMVRYGRLGFYIQSLSFMISTFFYSISKTNTLFYTRDEYIALMFKMCGKDTIWEAHMGHTNIFIRLLILFKTKIVVITEALKELYQSMGAKNILVAPDGADIGRFNISLSQKDARKQLGLPENKKIALYKGHLYEWKGAHTLAKAASLLPEDILCVFIGGTKEDVASFKEQFGSRNNILILGNRPRQETPIYQKAADLLIIPNSAKEDISKLYTSPMKLFGYMASGIPIIASDLPSLREIIDESLVYFFTPDDPQSLATVIQKALNTYKEAQTKGAKALELAHSYSWQSRAAAISKFSMK